MDHLLKVVTGIWRKQPSCICIPLRHGGRAEFFDETKVFKNLTKSAAFFFIPKTRTLVKPKLRRRFFQRGP
jgi:hypothetical protein